LPDLPLLLDFLPLFFPLSLLLEELLEEDDELDELELELLELLELLLLFST